MMGVALVNLRPRKVQSGIPKISQAYLGDQQIGADQPELRSRARDIDMEVTGPFNGRTLTREVEKQKNAQRQDRQIHGQKTDECALSDRRAVVDGGVEHKEAKGHQRPKHCSANKKKLELYTSALSNKDRLPSRLALPGGLIMPLNALYRSALAGGLGQDLGWRGIAGTHCQSSQKLSDRRCHSEPVNKPFW